MLRFRRPHKPEGFDARTRRARDAVAAKIERGESPASDDFKDLWRGYKSLFAAAQRGKCGYCEHDTGVSYRGDVEHYAPKAQIDRLRPLTDREEQRQRNLRPGEPTPPLPVEHPPFMTRGYYWLAYEWGNYLFACSTCNSIHKRCLFPVQPERRRDQLPAPENAETPLLLNPYEDGLNPGEHLRYNRDGYIFDNGSVRGWETIRTCRLNRVALNEARRERARQVTRLLDKLDHGARARNVAAVKETLTDIARLGDDGRRFAGMVRIMVECHTGKRWSALLAYCRRP